MQAVLQNRYSRDVGLAQVLSILFVLQVSAGHASGSRSILHS